MTLFVHTVFQNNLPLASALKHGDARPAYLPLYIQGTGFTLFDIWQREDRLRRIIRSVQPNDKVVINRFKDHLDYFKELISLAPVYDYQSNAPDASKETLLTFIDETSCQTIGEWQRLAAKAAIVYNGLQKRGILVYGHDLKFPTWSMDTYSGRSKNIGYNTQGVKADAGLRLVNSSADDLYVQFDWAAADINVAAILSGDELLSKLCAEGDPYEALRGHCAGLSRQECKDAMFAAINSMSADDEILTAFPRVRRWIYDARAKLEGGGSVETLLGRKFCIGEDRSILAAFNAQMQGTIAHAMHSALASIWDKFGQYLLTEIHDSIVMVVPFRHLKAVSDFVADVMNHPFAGILDSNPAFPVRISVGKKWRVWQKWKVVGNG